MASVLPTSKETMLTRNKLARQKLNCQTMKTLSQLLLRPNITITTKSILLKNLNETSKKGDIPTLDLTETTSDSASVNGTKPIKKSKSPTSEVKNKKVARSKSLDVEESKEFYPDKVKRNLATKKVVLEPKHQYKVVATTNKRKRGIPHRELESPPPEEQKLTMSELVRLADEEGMDDEDLMEILTCPSPVWWEDDDHAEEINIRYLEDTDEPDALQESESNTQKAANNNSKEDAEPTTKWSPPSNQMRKSPKTDINFFRKFIEKRFKLEKVLGSIKMKKAKRKAPRSNDEAAGKVRKVSTGGLSDASLNDEEMLKNLESIEIPVQKSNNDSERPNKAKANSTLGTDETETTNKRKPKKREKKLTRKAAKSKRANKFEVVSDDITQDRIIEIESEIRNELENCEAVPTDLPPLTKNPFRNALMRAESPKLIESLTSDTAIIEFDSISDTNIRFLDEYEDEKTESNKIDESKSFNKSKDEMVTIYRIIPNDHAFDIEDQIKMNLLNKSAERSVVNSEANIDIKPVSIKRRKSIIKKESKINSIKSPERLIVDSEGNKIIKIDSVKSLQKSIANSTGNMESEMNSTIAGSNESRGIEPNEVQSPEKSIITSEGNIGNELNSFYKKRKHAHRNKSKRQKLNEMEWQINEKITNLFNDLNTVKENNDLVKQIKYKHKPKHRAKGKKKVVPPPKTTIKYCHKCGTVFENRSCEYCTK